MTTNLDNLLSNTTTPKVYDTVIVTMVNDPKPKIEKFKSEADAINFAKMLVRDWLSMPNTKYEILDNYNIMLNMGGTNAVLLTREFEVLEAVLHKVERTIKNWGE